MQEGGNVLLVQFNMSQVHGESSAYVFERGAELGLMENMWIRLNI
jgi:hypothetical protein